MGRTFQLSNSINKDIVSPFGCDEYSKSLCRRIAVGKPGTSEGVADGRREYRYSILVNREPSDGEVTC